MQLSVDYLPVESLIPYVNNAKVHEEEQITQIAASIKEFGFNNPILVDDEGGVIAGHGRLMAAKKLGLEEVPTVQLGHLTEAQKKAYILADNRLAEINSSWDLDLVSVELESIEADLDISLTGFDDSFILIDSDEPLVDDDDVPEKPADPVSVAGDIWLCGEHRLMVGDSAFIDDVDKLMNGTLADMLLTDPPYNVAYVGKTKESLTIENDHMGEGDFRQFLVDAFTCADTHMKPGGVYYIWHADSEGYAFRGACYDAGWDVRQCLIWKKQTIVMGRQDYHWKHEPCQPPGALVRTPSGDVPIETLSDGDRVLSFDKHDSMVKGYRDGFAIKVASRDYSGCLYGPIVDDRQTWATDNHKFTVRFADIEDQYCTYLMKRGSWWRVGITSTYNARGFGLKHRMRQENADAAWILATYDSKADAMLAEEVLSCSYGIPQTHWEMDRGFKDRNYAARDEVFISRLYESFDLELMASNAADLLQDHGRSVLFPLITKASRNDKFSRRVTTQVHACNLVAGLMHLPYAFDSYQGAETTEWKVIESVEIKEYEGLVYSLDVDRYEHYIADGLVTHNCLYGWKDGAAHLWASDRKQSTVLEFDRPFRNAEHPTMKPVELFEYQILNNTKGKDVVLDLFGGSGTTMIACEKNGRRACLMELDPKYADVIITRWEEYTGKKAKLQGTGQGYQELKEQRIDG